MSVLSINCRGLGNTSAVSNLRNLIRKEAPSLVFLMETKLSSGEMSKIKAKFPGYEGLAVDSCGRSGGVALLWLKELEVVLRSMSIHHINLLVKRGIGDLEWRCTGFYGWPEDVPHSGYSFTYDNSQIGDDRLDRALANSSWMGLFPQVVLLNLEREWSDHALIKLMVRGDDNLAAKGERVFRFEQVWTENDSCEGVVWHAWENGGVTVESRIASCGMELRSWSDKEFGAIFKELRKKRKRLGVLNRGGRSVAQVNERRKIVKDIAQLLHVEEGYWRQRSRALWLVSGDRNTNFFHRKASQRSAKNKIFGLLTDDGLRHEGHEAVEKLEEALSGIDRRVTEEMNEKLCSNFTAEEMFITLKQMHPLKTPGADANRLKLFLSDITSINQSAFTPGRLITDNILVAFEVFHHMKTSSSDKGSLALKLDMAKEYDRVEWDFLKAVMQKLGFAEFWIDRVMHCVSSVSFLVLMNGAPSGEFTPTRGLWQGDPLSPYLEVARGALKGIKVASSAPPISHLLFADDSIIFSGANAEEVATIIQVLHTYESASGQLVNFDKTTVSFSKGVSEDMRVALAGILGVRMVDIHDKYLGLPTVVGRSKRVLTKGIQDKLWKNLQGCK
ncbi:uncharacterized protein LOC110726197 [Chenopodium quinoa]|uniref:uncharacterized protein LOC110726197 n=1 Tax=Chenopodium quinoa TaxID=63459 RepID=UPI000B7872BF|nr:uncharacterized protein LOC110726197 [Chenopodium quinoa]